MAPRRKNLDKLLSARAAKTDQLVQQYCTAIGWDRTRLQQALTTTGLADERLYLEEPNDTVITVLSDFLVSSASSLATVTGENGMGKSAFKDLALRAFAKTGQSKFDHFSIDSPRFLTDYQIMLAVSTAIGGKPVARSKGPLLAEVERRLIEIRDTSNTVTVIWVDESEKLTLDKVNVLRALADIRSPTTGLTACKIVMLGTPVLEQKVSTWFKDVPEDGGAIEDRVLINRVTLNTWTAQHIWSWWDLVTEFVARDEQNIVIPFTQALARVIADASGGKPRQIVQLTDLAILNKVRTWQPGQDIAITQNEVYEAIRVRSPGSVPA